jgi:hypothetical protein
MVTKYVSGTGFVTNVVSPGGGEARGKRVRVLGGRPVTLMRYELAADGLRLLATIVEPR